MPPRASNENPRNVDPLFSNFGPPLIGSKGCFPVPVWQKSCLSGIGLERDSLRDDPKIPSSVKKQKNAIGITWPFRKKNRLLLVGVIAALSAGVWRRRT